MQESVITAPEVVQPAPETIQPIESGTKFKNASYAKIASEVREEKAKSKKVVEAKIEAKPTEPPIEEKVVEVAKPTEKKTIEAVIPTEKEAVTNKAPEQIQDEEDYNSLMDFISDEKPIKAEEKKQEDTVKQVELDPIYSNPLIEAVVASVRNGETDLLKIAEQIGLIDVKKMSIEDLVMLQAKEQGFEGDELDIAVEEEIERFDSLGKIGRKKAEDLLRSEYKNKSSDKLKTYTENIGKAQREQQIEFQKITDTADKELRQTLSELEGKKRLFMQLTKPMIEQIEQLAPLYTPHKYDANGKIIGLDIQKGIDNTILELHQKTIFKNITSIARKAGYDEAMKDKHRPNSNEGAGTPTIPVKEIDKGQVALDYYARRNK